MNPEFGPEDLEALGLAGATVVEADAFMWPDGGASEGSKAAAAGLMLIELLSFARFRTVESLQLAEQHALHIQADLEHRGVLRISTPPGVEISDVRGLPDDRVYADPGDRGIVSLYLPEAAQTAVGLTDGRILNVSINGGRVTLRWLALDEPLPLASIDAREVLAWSEQIGDPWLKEHLASYVALDDPWHSAAAAGLFVRLRVLAPADARTAVARLLAGQPDLRAEPAFLWISQLNDAQRSTISDLALAEIDALLTALEDVESLVDEGGEGWRDVLQDVAIRRDDLEAVRVLIGTVGGFERVQPVLDFLDSVGVRTVASLPERAEFDDERLNRVRDADPHAWWLRLTGV